MSITPLHAEVDHEIDPDHDTRSNPLKVVNDKPPLEFFAFAADALRRNPPHPTDFAVLARISHLGLVAGRPFDRSRFSPDEIAAIEAGVQEALADMIAAIPTIGTSANGWATFSDLTGVYGNQYFIRAVVALAGLGADPAEEAVYPLLVADADGEPVVGERDYLLHFGADQLPPVDAFWSLTMYDVEGFQVPNQIDRFAPGDRDPLTYDPDGSLDIFLPSSHPGPERECNWLPSQPGPLGAMLRLYAPHEDVLAGRWHPPTVHQIG